MSNNGIEPVTLVYCFYWYSILFSRWINYYIAYYFFVTSSLWSSRKEYMNMKRTPKCRTRKYGNRNSEIETFLLFHPWLYSLSDVRMLTKQKDSFWADEIKKNLITARTKARPTKDCTKSQCQRFIIIFVFAVHLCVWYDIFVQYCQIHKNGTSTFQFQKTIMTKLIV